MTGAITYFAYGSNMFVPRLSYRIGGFTIIGRARLTGFALHFHKRSADGSGKCNALQTGDATDFVEGALYALPPEAKAVLDRLEGASFGYAEHVATVESGGHHRRAVLYVARDASIDALLRPYDWYRDFVLSGARLHGLAPGYIANRIACVKIVADPDPRRAARRRAEVSAPDAAQLIQQE